MAFNQALWYIPVIPSLGRWTRGDWRFKVSLSYIVSLKPTWTPKDLFSNKTKTK